MNVPALRFSSLEHLEAYRDGGIFPGTHSALVGFIAANAFADRFCDLASGLGLLGEQLRVRLGKFCIGVEKDAEYNAAARAAGVQVSLIDLRITPATFPQFRELLVEHRIQAIVARRAAFLYHEIGDGSQGQKSAPGIVHGEGWHMTEFAELCAGSGVTEVFLQGETSGRWTIDHDVKCFSPPFRQRVRESPDRAYLTLPKT